MKTEYHIFWEWATTSAIDGEQRTDTQGGHGDICEAASVFDTAKAAEAYMMAEARADVVEVGPTRYGPGRITRNVYYVEKFTYDDDGEFVEDDGNPVASVDVLDFHLRISEAWNRALGKYASFMDYEAEGYPSLSSELEREFGEDWEGIIRRNEDLEN